MTVRGEHYEMHPNSLRRKVLYEVKTQKKSIPIIAELNGLPATTVSTWVKQAGLDIGRPSYQVRRYNPGNQVKLPTDYEVDVISRLLQTWRFR